MLILHLQSNRLGITYCFPHQIIMNVFFFLELLRVSLSNFKRNENSTNRWWLLIA